VLHGAGPCRTRIAPSSESSFSVLRSIFTSIRTLPSGATKPPCAVPVWMLILLMPVSLPRAALYPFMKGAQFVRVRVLAADLADLAANRDGHTLGFEAADVAGEVGRQLAVHGAAARRASACRESTSVEVSISMLKKPAAISSVMRARSAFNSLSRSGLAYFFAFTWTWSPWMNGGQ